MNENNGISYIEITKIINDCCDFCIHDDRHMGGTKEYDIARRERWSGYKLLKFHIMNDLDKHFSIDRVEIDIELIRLKMRVEYLENGGSL